LGVKDEEEEGREEEVLSLVEARSRVAGSVDCSVVVIVATGSDWEEGEESSGRVEGSGGDQLVGEKVVVVSTLLLLLFQ
jgi:hypothetical protein